MPEQGLNVRNWLERFLNPSNLDLVVARAQYGAASNPDVLRAQARGQIASDFELAMSQHVASTRAEERERCAGVICLACRSGLPRTERDGRWTHDFDCAHDTYNPNGYDWDFCPADALHRLTPEPRHA